MAQVRICSGVPARLLSRHALRFRGLVRPAKEREVLSAIEIFRQLRCVQLQNFQILLGNPNNEGQLLNPVVSRHFPTAKGWKVNADHHEWLISVHPAIASTVGGEWRG
jgi:hypothetical protein